MKNIIASFIIFILLLLTLFFSVSYLNQACLKLEDSSDQIESYIEKDSWQKAYSASTKLLDDWQNHSSKIAAFIDHQEIDNINVELWKLSQYIKCGNKEESLASVHTIKFFLKHIMGLEKINFENIF